MSTFTDRSIELNVETGVGVEVVGGGGRRRLCVAMNMEFSGVASQSLDPFQYMETNLTIIRLTDGSIYALPSAIQLFPDIESGLLHFLSYTRM